MGPLHIEMMLLSCIGDWLNGSGWCEMYESSKVSTAGKIESFLKGSKVKRTRYAHHVTLSVLLTLAKESFDQQTLFTSYKDWKENLSKTSVNAYYWFTVIDLEVMLFMFVKSLRDPNLDLFVRSLKEILTWTFALDHIHYARWLSVFVHDIVCLGEEHPDLFQQFEAGHFTIKKSDRLFSNIGIDQAHEQNNKKVKIDGGAVGIFENEDAMLDWAVSGPIIAEILDSYNESYNDERKQRRHHEDSDVFEKTFFN